MIGTRRRSREVALQIIHQMDSSPEMDADAALRVYFDNLFPDASTSDWGEVSGPPPALERPMIEELVRGFHTNRQELDEILTALSRNWRVERMSPVDRNVIRLALYELKYCETVPVNVAINEAIELAKRFGTTEGAAFVNGMLDRAVSELGIRR
ncbi:MAG TPA: transcription antitermination factor NusB [Polyangia bacterium]|nr:transcription antitermination factor NusB [Polyangia bacterium]